jgi:hypothetical protein
MTTITAITGTNVTIDTEIETITNTVIVHLRHQRSIRLLTFMILLPVGLEDNENRLFLAFAESFRGFLEFDRCAPICLWLQDQVGGYRGYRCAWFLNDFPTLPVEGYLKIATTIWRKTLGASSSIGLIQRHLPDSKIKPCWNENLQAIDVGKRWVAEMRRRANRVPDPRQALQTFGAVHAY